MFNGDIISLKDNKLIGVVGRRYQGMIERYFRMK